MKVKFASIECPKCLTKKRIRISAYPFEEDHYDSKEGCTVYIASDLQCKCKCGNKWREIHLYEYYEPYHIEGYAVI